MNEAMLALKGIVRSFPVAGKEELEVLKGIDLEIARGKFVSITGISGSGKSTLLHIAGGLDSPTRGDVSFNGKLLRELSDAEQSELRNTNFGFIFQFHYLIKELTAFENILLPSMIKNPKEDRERAGLLLEEVGLYARKDHYPNQLSGGELQRVAIARALVNSPRIIFADEPTGELDNENAEKVFRMLLDITGKYEHSLLLVTHNREFASEADESYRLHFGLLEKI